MPLLSGALETSMVAVALKLEIWTAYSVPMLAMVAIFASVPGAAWCSLDLSLPGAGCVTALGFAWCQDPQRIPGQLTRGRWRQCLLQCQEQLGACWTSHCQEPAARLLWTLLGARIHKGFPFLGVVLGFSWRRPLLLLLHFLHFLHSSPSLLQTGDW